MKIWELPQYSQIIQPYMFGDEYMKTTCLWLKNIPGLFATDIVVPTSKWVASSIIVRRNEKMHGLKVATEQRNSEAKHSPALQKQWQNNGGKMKTVTT